MNNFNNYTNADMDMDIDIDIEKDNIDNEINNNINPTFEINSSNYGIKLELDNLNNVHLASCKKNIQNQNMNLKNNKITPLKIPELKKNPILNNKKFNNDKELLDFIMNTSYNTDIISDSDNADKKPKTVECPNPLCDHKDFSLTELKNNNIKKPVVNIENIIDLIELGKTYHCKKNKVYYGVDLKTLCNLVTPLTELKNLVGLQNVKEAIVDQIVFFLQGFNEKKKCNNCIDCTYNLQCSQSSNDDMLHTVITGPPGVGKTELGKILGHIYKGMGVLSKGHMHIASRSDLVGKFLGHTAAKTQAFIDKCQGGVMFIDEAYSLGNPEGRDSFSKECIDTINQNLTEKRDLLCIIAGYKNDLEKCFFSYNAGLARRFTFRYDIEGYSSEELMDIFLIKLKKEGWIIEFEVEENHLNKINLREKLRGFFAINSKNFPHYGGDIETLFLNCKIYHGRRMLFKDASLRKILTLHDVKKGFETYLANRDNKINKIKEPERSISQQMMYM